MWYGSVGLRHGRSRPLSRYHSSSRCRNRCGCRRPAAARRCGAGFGVRRTRHLEPVALRRRTLVWNVPIIRSVKIYTRTGDAGETGLFDGTRVSKSDAARRRLRRRRRAERLARAGAGRDVGRAAARRCSNRSSAICLRSARASRIPAHRIAGARHQGRGRPGGHRRGSKSWIDRSKPSCRRCAASSWPAARRPARRCTSRARSAAAPSARWWRSARAVEPELLVYINRLSDLLFVMARAANHRAGRPKPSGNADDRHDGARYAYCERARPRALRELSGRLACCCRARDASAHRRDLRFCADAPTISPTSRASRTDERLRLLDDWGSAAASGAVSRRSGLATRAAQPDADDELDLRGAARIRSRQCGCRSRCSTICSARSGRT